MAMTFADVRKGTIGYLVYVNGFTRLARMSVRVFAKPFTKDGTRWSSKHHHQKFAYYSSVLSLPGSAMTATWAETNSYSKGRIFLDPDEAEKYYKELSRQDVPIYKERLKELQKKKMFLEKKIDKLERKISSYGENPYT